MRGAFAATVLCLLGSITGACSAGSPNVLFLFSDDQRADTIRALGNHHIETPNLDRLVESGAAFQRAYCMGSMQPAVCVPSRAMLMTGRPLPKVIDNLQGQATWPEAFARAGYKTFMTGKWHNGPAALLRAFVQGQAVFLGGMGDPYSLTIQDMSKGALVNKRTTGRHSVEVFADAAIGFLTNQTATAPFLAYVAFNLPHDPRIAPTNYHQAYQLKPPPLPRNYLPEHPFDNGELKIRDEQLERWPRTREAVTRHLGDYYAAITFLDAQIGRILEALGDTGLAENTLVVFASDHGLAIGSHGLFGKQNLYEHSTRAPLIFAGRGIPKAIRSDALCYLYDIFPTLGELCRVPPPEGSDGLSLASILQGKTNTHRQLIFTAYRQVQRAVCDQEWKMIAYPSISRTQLFNLKLDPDEMNDLSTNETFLDQQRRLQALLSTSPFLR